MLIKFFAYIWVKEDRTYSSYDRFQVQITESENNLVLLYEYMLKLSIVFYLHHFTRYPLYSIEAKP